MKKPQTKKLARIGLLMAITIVLAATPLGYVYIPVIGLSLTIMVLPVALGGSIMGIPTGLLLGLTFGITSLIKAPTEALGQLLIGQSWALTILICIVPRLAVGFVAGAFKKPLEKNPSFLLCAIVGAATSLTNTALFLGLIYLFARPLVEGAFGVLVWSSTLFGGLSEAVLASILCTLIIKPLRKIIKA